MDGSDPFEESKGVFQSSDAAWGFQSNGAMSASTATAAATYNIVDNEDEDLNEEERERVDQAEAEWEEKKRGFFEF